MGIPYNMRLWIECDDCAAGVKSVVDAKLKDKLDAETSAAEASLYGPHDYKGAADRLTLAGDARDAAVKILKDEANLDRSFDYADTVWNDVNGSHVGDLKGLDENAPWEYTVDHNGTDYTGLVRLHVKS